MFVLEVEPGQLQAAHAVAQNAEILTVRMRRSSFTMLNAAAFLPGGVVTFRFDWHTEPHEVLSSGALRARAGLRMEIGVQVQQDGEGVGTDTPPEPLAQIDLLYEVHYQIPGAPVPEEIERLGGLKAFAKWNALFNCWPFFREEVRRLCVAAELPPVALPLLLLRAKPSSPVQ